MDDTITISNRGPIFVTSAMGNVAAEISYSSPRNQSINQKSDPLFRLTEWSHGDTHIFVSCLARPYFFLHVVGKEGSGQLILSDLFCRHSLRACGRKEGRKEEGGEEVTYQVEQFNELIHWPSGTTSGSNFSGFIIPS